MPRRVGAKKSHRGWLRRVRDRDYTASTYLNLRISIRLPDENAVLKAEIYAILEQDIYPEKLYYMLTVWQLSRI